MINYRAEIKDSWVQTAPSVRELAALLDMSTPVGLRDIIERLHMVETVFADREIHTDDDAAINGRVAFELRSDGSYVFSGHMRATGATSYHYGVQAWVATSDGTAIAALQTGDVYGTDTPGDRQDNWSQPGDNPGIKLHWRSLRANRSVGYNMQAELDGVLGSAVDVLEFVLKGVAANMVLGHVGWLLLIGNELAGLDAEIGAPGTLGGVFVAGDTLMILGPFGLVPAIVAGAAIAELINVRHRKMESWERDFANTVFKNKIDYDRVILTNMTHGNNKKFAIPSVGSTILVNLGDAALDNPTTYKDEFYPESGSLFIHELTHAWQISHNSIVDLISGLSDNYAYFQGIRTEDTSWHARSWAGFNNEQQASIVDDWYGIYTTNNNALNSFNALNDPAFRFIRDHIWTGIN